LCLCVDKHEQNGGGVVMTKDGGIGNEERLQITPPTNRRIDLKVFFKHVWYIRNMRDYPVDPPFSLLPQQI